MADQITRADFAKQLKAKYPSYAAVPDEQLVDRMLEKFPVYRDRVIAAAPSAQAASNDSGARPATMGNILKTSPMVQAIGAIPDVVIGAGKSAVDTVSQLGTLARKIPGVAALDRVMTPVPVQTDPTNDAQKVGRFIEKTAELAIPASKVATLTKGASLLPRMAAQAVTAGTVAGAQTGGNPTDMTVAATLGGAAPLVGAAATTTGRKLFDVLPEKLYAQVFRYADGDLRKAYQAIAKGRPAPPTLAKEMLDRGVMGSSDDMAVYSLQKLDALEHELQTKAGRQLMVMPEKAKYIGLLQEVKDRFGNSFFSNQADEASDLMAALKKAPGPSAWATDMLRVKRLLDGLRNSSSFRADPVLAPRQEELKVAADLVRTTLHKKAALSPLLKDEKIFIEAVDAIVNDAVRRGNKSVFGLIDAALSSAGPKGVAAAATVRGAQTPKVMTSLAQRLYQGGKVLPDAGMVTRGVAAGGAVAAR